MVTNSCHRDELHPHGWGMYWRRVAGAGAAAGAWLGRGCAGSAGLAPWAQLFRGGVYWRSGWAAGRCTCGLGVAVMAARCGRGVWVGSGGCLEGCWEVGCGGVAVWLGFLQLWLGGSAVARVCPAGVWLVRRHWVAAPRVGGASGSGGWVTAGRLGPTHGGCYGGLRLLCLCCDSAGVVVGDCSPEGGRRRRWMELALF
ncbi:hypothetical protein Tco_0431036 [Tanacetum coccineum]